MDFLAEITVDQKLTILIAFSAALLGGLISFGASWFTTRQSINAAETTRKNEKREREAFYAHQGLIKIQQYANAVFSAKKLINDQFDAAYAEDHGDWRPVQKVQEMLSADAKFERFLAEEMVFLLRTKDAQLLGDMIIFEKRVISSLHSLEAYSGKRKKWTEKLEANVVAVLHGKGTTLSADLEGKEAMIADAEAAALDGIIGHTMETLCRDVIDGKSLLERYNVAAKQEYGNLFPTLKFEAPNANP